MVKEFKSLQQIMDYILELIDKMMDDLIEQLKAEMQKNIVDGDFPGAKGKGADNLGTMLRSFLITKGKHKKEIWVQAPYAPFVEYGTKPHRPPFKPINEWVIRKFQIPKKESYKLTNYIRNKIEKYGTPKRPFTRQAIAYVFSDQNLERTFKKYFPN